MNRFVVVLVALFVLGTGISVSVSAQESVAVSCSAMIGNGEKVQALIPADQDGRFELRPTMDAFNCSFEWSDPLPDYATLVTVVTGMEPPVTECSGVMVTEQIAELNFEHLLNGGLRPGMVSLSCNLNWGAELASYGQLVFGLAE